MALITSLQNGDWNDTATWVGGVVPVVDVDTVSIGHVVTLTQDTAIGVSPAGLAVTPAIRTTVGGRLVVGPYKLTVKGDIVTSSTDGATELVLSNNSWVYFDNSLAPSPATDAYRLVLTARYAGTIPALLVRASPGARAKISSVPGNAPAYITGLGAPYGGLVDAEYLTVENMGDTTNPALAAIAASDGADSLASVFRLYFVEFINSSRLSVSVTGEYAKVSIQHVTHKNTQDTVSMGWFSYVVKLGLGVRLIENSIFDKIVNLFAPQDVIVSGNQFHDSLLTASTDKDGWDLFADNLVVMQSTSEGVVARADITNNYFLYNDPLKTNPHFVFVGGDANVATFTSSGNVFEFTGSNEEGDTQLVSSKGAPTTIRFLNNLVVPNLTGGSSGTLVTALGNVNITLVIENNTGLPGLVQPVVALGETYPGHPNMVASFRRNLGWDNTVREFLAADALPDDAVTDLLAAAVTQYNGVYNLATGTNGVGFTRFELSTGSLTTTSIAADPQFVDKTRNFAKWDVYAGGTGDIDNALYELSLANDDVDYKPSYNIQSLYNYVREGFTPQQTAFLNVGGVEGAYIGAVLPQLVPSYPAAIDPCVCTELQCNGWQLDPRQIQAFIALLLCAQEQHVDTEVVVMCEPGTARPVLVTYRFDAVGNEESATAQYLDGTVYPGALDTLTNCTDIPHNYVIEYPICDNGIQKLVQVEFLNDTQVNVIYLDIARLVTTAPADFNLVTYGDCPITTGLTVETYRLDGNAAPGASTPSTGPLSTPTIGDTVTILPPFKALSWRFMRGTLQDPNNGSVSSLVVNGFTYFPGNGPVYQEVGQNIQSSTDEEFGNTYTFTANGTAIVEIVVHR